MINASNVYCHFRIKLQYLLLIEIKIST